MSAAKDTPERVKASVRSLYEDTSAKEKIDFYNNWAENYEQDMDVLDYRAPYLAAKYASAHFSGDRHRAVVLDVACGTGMVAKDLKALGFENFVGIDGSEGMLEIARRTGLYQDLKKCMLGNEPLPVQLSSFDVVVIAGALSIGQVPVKAVRDMVKAAKPGGHVCMTTRIHANNMEHKKALELELKKMEEEGICSCVEVDTVSEWVKAVLEKGEGYVSGIVYVYKRL